MMILHVMDLKVILIDLISTNLHKEREMYGLTQKLKKREREIKTLYFISIFKPIFYLRCASC